MSDKPMDPLVTAFLAGPDAMAAVSSRLAAAQDPRAGLVARIWAVDPDQDALPEPLDSLIAEVRGTPLRPDTRAILTYFLMARTRFDQLDGEDYLGLHRDLSNAALACEVPILRALPIVAAMRSGFRTRKRDGSRAIASDHRGLGQSPLTYASLFVVALAGLAEPTLSQLDALGSDQISRPADRLQAQLFNAIMTGNSELAMSLLDNVRYDAERNRTMSAVSLPLTWFMHSLQNGLAVTQEEIAIRLERSGFEPGNTFHDDIRDLLMMAYLGAEDLRQIAERPHAKQLICTSFSAICFNPIRAATMLGDIDLAADLLQFRARSFLDNYLDHLFWMRLHLLDQDEDKAATHLRLLMQGARHHRAMGRVEFELRLAKELPLARLVELQSGRGGMPAEPLHAQAAPPATTPAAAHGAPILQGGSQVMAAVQELIGTYASNLLPVLITGETGTGKDLVARVLHSRSTNAAEPYVAVNCGSINDNLLEAELFGHVQGSYTGATTRRQGLIASAGFGTLFLDEIGDTSPRFQVALLRLLENATYRPIGSDQEAEVRCRILAATNVDLEEAVSHSAFRRDLYFRLQRLEIRLPPLRERREDIPLLAERFLNVDNDGPKRRLDGDLAAYLSGERWPGNVRQLRNEMELLRIHMPLRRTVGIADYLGLPHRRGTTARRAPAASDRPATASAPPAVPPPTAPMQADLGLGSPLMARLERLRGLFRDHHRLTRKQVMGLLAISHATATNYLKRLAEEGFITKISPNAGPASHYFERND